MTASKIQRVKSITEYHRLRGLPKPEHPLISVIDYSTIKPSPDSNDVSWVFDFYSVSLKKGFLAKMKYGQQECDFDEGILFFMAPGQVFRIIADENHSVKRSG